MMKSNMTKHDSSRRTFLRATAVGGTALLFTHRLVSARKRSVLVFTKSSGFEHDVVKTPDGKPSIVEQAVRDMGQKHGFDVNATKDGRIFDSSDFRAYSALFFFTTGDLTKSGTDGQPPMTENGKKALLEAVHSGVGFVGAHAASDTFHTQPDPEDHSN